MAILFVENDDSFSWNVVDALPFRRGAIRIVRGTDHEGVRRALDSADALVVGPGPMDPVRAGLTGLVSEAADRRLPVLGICLGHQAIGLAFGARLERVDPCHGKQSTFDLRSRFLPTGRIVAMRYHSLALVNVPLPLKVVASTADGIVMAVEHESLPILGLQFHPDSFGTPRGRELLEAFFDSVHIGRSASRAVA